MSNFRVVFRVGNGRDDYEFYTYTRTVEPTERSVADDPKAQTLIKSYILNAQEIIGRKAGYVKQDVMVYFDCFDEGEWKRLQSARLTFEKLKDNSRCFVLVPRSLYLGNGAVSHEKREKTRAAAEAQLG